MVARHPLSIDQVLPIHYGDLRHFWIDVFFFKIRLGGLCNEKLLARPEGYKKDFRPQSWDGAEKCKWQMMSPVEKVALETVMDCV